MIPLHKGGDKCNITNYREITLGIRAIEEESG